MRHRAARPARSWGRRLIILTQCAAMVVGLSIVLVPSTATADTPYTFVDQKFESTTFPPTDWEITSGDWTRDCTPASPGGGCFATATVTSADPTDSRLLFKPSTAIPANLENATLSFTSSFDPGTTSSGDSAQVMQPLFGSDLGDRRLLFNVSSSGDTPGVPTTHTVPLDHFNLPLVFDWTSFGDTGASPSKTWGTSRSPERCRRLPTR